MTQQPRRHYRADDRIELTPAGRRQLDATRQLDQVSRTNPTSEEELSEEEKQELEWGRYLSQWEKSKNNGH